MSTANYAGAPSGEAERTSMYSWFVLATLTIGHGYFTPFSTTTGQIVLVVIAGLFAVGFGMMNRLSRPQPMPRLFASPAQPS